MLTNTDITLFSSYTEGRETKYKRSYIYNVHWEDSQGVNIIQSGLTAADKSKVYIPFASLESMPVLANNIKNYIKSEDVIVKGIVEDDFTTLKALELKYVVRVVTTVDVRDYGSYEMQHYEVGAK